MSRLVFPDAETLAAHAAELVAEACREAVLQRGSFHLTLAGGTTPRRCYELLRAMSLPWPQLHIYFGDERCLPVGHAERNDVMADEALLAHVPIPAEHIHRIPAQLGPQRAAAEYDAILQSIAVMDMVLLGMGEDGHTASLFPDHATLEDEIHLALPVYNSPKPPAERVTMSLTYLNRVRSSVIMAAGSGKRVALARIAAGENLPVARIKNPLWLLDQAALPSG